MEPDCGSAAAELCSLRRGRDSPNKKCVGRRGNNVDWEKWKMPPKQITSDSHPIWTNLGERAVPSQGLQSKLERPNPCKNRDMPGLQEPLELGAYTVRALGLSPGTFLLSNSVFPG